MENYKSPTTTSPDDWWKYYSQKTQGYMDQIEEKKPFSFDVNSDPLYEQLNDQYVNQGRMAMMDTMGRAATMTGGYGNSYAQTAGQQAFNQYMGQLNSAIPELYESAYTKWQNEGNDLYNKYSLYASARDSAKTELETEQNDMLTKIAGGYQATDEELKKLGLTKNDVNAYLSANTNKIGKEQTASREEIERVIKNIDNISNEDDLLAMEAALKEEGWGENWVKIYVGKKGAELIANENKPFHIPLIKESIKDSFSEFWKK